MNKPIRQWPVKSQIGGGTLEHGHGIGIRFTGEDREMLDIIIPYEGLNKAMLAIFKLSHEARMIRLEKGVIDDGFSAYSNPLFAIETLQLSRAESDPARMLLQLQLTSGMVLSFFLGSTHVQALQESLSKNLGK